MGMCLSGRLLFLDTSIKLFMKQLVSNKEAARIAKDVEQFVRKAAEDTAKKMGITLEQAFKK